MLNLASGIDLIEIERLEGAIARYGDRLLKKIFTPREIAEVGDNPASLAARFAAKEALAKALGTGIGVVTWQDIEILRGPNKQPFLHLHGAAARLAKSKKLSAWTLSLSHTQDHAIAVVVGMGD